MLQPRADPELRTTSVVHATLLIPRLSTSDSMRFTSSSQSSSVTASPLVPPRPVESDRRRLHGLRVCPSSRSGVVDTRLSIISCNAQIIFVHITSQKANSHLIKPLATHPQQPNTNPNRTHQEDGYSSTAASAYTSPPAPPGSNSTAAGNSGAAVPAAS
jgi:hypothetical protein